MARGHAAHHSTCGLPPSAGALLHPHHPTQGDGTVRAPLMRTQAPGEGGQSHTGQDTQSCAQMVAQLPLHSPDPVLAP